MCISDEISKKKYSLRLGGGAFDYKLKFNPMGRIRKYDRIESPEEYGLQHREHWIYVW